MSNVNVYKQRPDDVAGQSPLHHAGLHELAGKGRKGAGVPLREKKLLGHLVLRGQGHGTLGLGCMPRLLGQFMESADAKALDASCLDSLSYVPPFTSFNGWEP